jgi:hypothetical protein
MAHQKWVPTITGQGAERLIASTTFNLPGYDPNQPLIDCPSFSTRTEWAENWQGGTTAVYTYGSGVTDPTGRQFPMTQSFLGSGLICFSAWRQFTELAQQRTNGESVVTPQVPNGRVHRAAPSATRC